MRPRLSLRALVPLVALATSACFATRNDVRVLQGDITALRAERALGDSARAAQIDRIIGQLQVATDSLKSLAGQSSRFQGDARESLRELRETVLQVQELTGQSQRRLQEIRASIETPRVDSTATGPGPNQLYQLAFDQYSRGSYSAARTAFNDLLAKYPTADVSADALYYIAESFAAEKNTIAADTTYDAVVTRFPAAPRAPSALYKRAKLRVASKQTADAKTLIQELRRKYPKSDEAALSCELVANVCPKR